MGVCGWPRKEGGEVWNPEGLQWGAVQHGSCSPDPMPAPSAVLRAVSAINAAIRRGIPAATLQALLEPSAQLPAAFPHAAALYQHQLALLQRQHPRVGAAAPSGAVGCLWGVKGGGPVGAQGAFLPRAGRAAAGGAVCGRGDAVGRGVGEQSCGCWEPRGALGWSAQPRAGAVGGGGGERTAVRDGGGSVGSLWWGGGPWGGGRWFHGSSLHLPGKRRLAGQGASLPAIVGSVWLEKTIQSQHPPFPPPHPHGTLQAGEDPPHPLPPKPSSPTSPHSHSALREPFRLEEPPEVIPSNH